MNAHDPDPFRLLWNLGYRRLVPIVPPDAPLAPGSKMAANAARGKDARGKAPGVKTLNGWDGLPLWTTCQPTEITLLEWRAMGAGAGIVTGTHGEWTLLALDADAKSPDHENLIETTIIEITGAKLPKRVGQAPKAIYVCKVRGNVNGDKIYFGDKEEFEVRSHGQQFVAWGKHRLTGENYRWTAGLPPFDELPEVSAAQIGALMTALQARLPKSTRRSGGDTAEVDQASLRGEPAQIEAAIAALPNSDNRFPGRSDYLDVGYAIKAAYGPQREAAAFACFWSWCEKWDGGDNDRDEAEEDWRRMKPPFRRGAQWLYGIAAEYGTFDPAAPWIESVKEEETEAEPLFPEHPIEPELETRSAATFGAHEAPPPQRWLAGTLIPARQVTMLFGDGGTGKSLAALQLAASVAAGRPWLGLPTMKGPALFLTAEDEIDEVHRRLAQLVKADGLEWSELADLHIASLDGEDATLATVNPKTGGMVRTALFERLETTLARLRPVLCVLDTLADLFGGDEIKRLQARQFIGMLRGQIARADFELTEVLLAHPSVAGMANDSGSSGSTAWSNSVRSRLYLKRRYTDKEKTREIDPDVRVLAVRKANRARAGGDMTLRWICGRFVALEGLKAAEDDEDAADEMAFLDFLDSFSRSNRFASESPTSSNYAPRAFAKESGGDKIDEARLAKAMGRLFGRERPAIVNIDYGSPSRKKQRIARAPEAGEPDLFG